MRAARYQAVIFDLFGTLAPFSPLAHARVVADMARLLELPPAEFERVWNTTYLAQEQGGLATLDAAIRHVFREMGRSLAPSAFDAAYATYVAFQRGTLTPRPEAANMLEHIRSLGYATGLISNCPGIAADLWPASPLAGLIDAAIFSCRVGLVKPDPRIYHLACERLQVLPEYCLYVGDGGSRELSGAVSCGMDAVLLRPDDDDPEDAQILGREEWGGLVIRSLSQLCYMLKP